LRSSHFLSDCTRALPAPPSLPTRRSSDLTAPAHHVQELTPHPRARQRLPKAWRTAHPPTSSVDEYGDPRPARAAVPALYHRESEDRLPHRRDYFAPEPWPAGDPLPDHQPEAEHQLPVPQTPYWRHGGPTQRANHSEWYRQERAVLAACSPPPAADAEPCRLHRLAFYGL